MKLNTTPQICEGQLRAPVCAPVTAALEVKPTQSSCSTNTKASLFTRQETAAILRVSTRTILRYTKAGRLPAYRSGPRLLYLDQDVARLMLERKQRESVLLRQQPPSLRDELKLLLDELDFVQKQSNPLKAGKALRVILREHLKAFSWFNLISKAKLEGLNPTPQHYRTLALFMTAMKFGGGNTQPAQYYGTIWMLAGKHAPDFALFLESLGLLDPNWFPTPWVFKNGLIVTKRSSGDDTETTPSELWFTHSGYLFFGFIWDLYEAFGMELFERVKPEATT
ncbi:MAG: DNA-binding protein [Sphingobacteriales bacterium]|nr:MAG: DNA-binding protein [Sphingobacteriales bacterium]